MFRDARISAEGDANTGRHRPSQRLAGDRYTPLDLGHDLRRIGVRISGQPFEIAVHRRQGRHIVGPRLAKQAQGLVVEDGPVLDRIGTQPQCHIDAVRAVGMDRDLEAVKVRRLDQGLRLVLEHLGPQTGPDPAVDPAGGGDLDHPDTAPDLEAHGLAAALDAVADIVVGDGLAEVVIEAQPPVHMAGGRRDAVARVDDARTGQPVGGGLVRQRQGHPALVAKVPNRGEAGHQRLLRILGRPIGMGRQVLRNAGQEARLTAQVRNQMHMAVDQARHHEPLALIDDSRAREGRGVDEAVANLDNPPVPHNHGGGAARSLTRSIQKPSRLDQGHRAGPGNRLLLRHHRCCQHENRRNPCARRQSVHDTSPEQSLMLSAPERGTPEPPGS